MASYWAINRACCGHRGQPVGRSSFLLAQPRPGRAHGLFPAQSHRSVHRLGPNDKARIQNVPPDTIRTNPLGIQMLSSSLQRAVFPQQRDSPVHPEQIALSMEHLKRQGIWGKKTTQTQPLELHPPPLRGATIQEHFLQVGAEMAEPYLSMAKRAVAMALPPLPHTWQQGQSGWTRYAYPTEASRRSHTPVVTTVPYPSEDVLVFDVEVLFKQSPFPILACAASEHAWYLWVSPYLLNESDQFAHLIPLSAQGQQSRVIIGHNVGFDRIRVADEYRLKPTGHCYLDTMSLHSAVSGLCNQQRVDWMYYQGVIQNAESSTSKPRAPPTKAAPYQLADLKLMASVGSTNSLKQVAKLHCGVDLDKEIREMFNTPDKQEIVDNFQLAVTYCAKDVLTTHQVYQTVFPKFLQKCPHPVSFAGMVDMASAILPVTDRWEQFIATCEAQFTTLSAAIETKIQNLAEAALALQNTTDVASDPWFRHLDWTVAPIRMTKPKLLKDGRVAPGGESRPMARQKLPGKPEWYKSLWDAKTKAIRVTTKTRITPYLLKLKWRGFPLYFSDAYGWTYRVPRDQADEICEVPLAFASSPDDPAYEAYPTQDRDGCYFRIPHPDGDGLRCLQPLGKSYITAFEEGILTSEYEEAREALQLSALCSYWISCRERVKSQLVIWDTHRPSEIRTTDFPLLATNASHTSDKCVIDSPSLTPLKQGLILPMVVPMGTVTRRAVEPTWMTASNAKKNRLGSELKSLVQAPPGYCLVGADVDSEELWISSLIGDAQFGMHGATALGWMTLQGTKSEDTDLHSNTARIMNISRNNAKVFNYGRIYGAGVKFATQLLKKFNPKMSQTEATQVAQKLYRATKGAQRHPAQAFRLPSVTFKLDPADQPAKHPKIWCGGSESFMFNGLESVAFMSNPQTPTLGCGITDTLTPRVAGSRYVTSRVNWVVQSSGVDYLHLLIVSMKYLIRHYGIDARFLISIHDEIRYLVRYEDRYRAALALQVANLWTRALFSYRLGMEELPQSVAFFSAVDIDHVLRKEVDLDCVTPSNPTPIPPGESLTIEQLLAHTGGSLGANPNLASAPTNPEAQSLPLDPSAALSSKAPTVTDFRHLRAQMATSQAELDELFPPNPLSSKAASKNHQRYAQATVTKVSLRSSAKTAPA